MKEKTNFFTDNLKVLHVAPELCFMKRFDEMPNIDYITGDIESPMAKVKMDVHDIPFKEGEFDVAMCNHVMEHVDDDHKAMTEFYRDPEAIQSRLLGTFLIDPPASCPGG